MHSSQTSDSIDEMESSQTDVEMLQDQSTPNFELSEEIEQRFSRHESGEGSNCSSTLPLPSRINSGYRENFESLSADEEDMKAQEGEDEVFVDAVADLDYSPFDRLQGSSSNSRTFTSGVTTEAVATSTINTSSSPIYRENSIGLLERCGRWLISIPRDDVLSLQDTVEYREFLNAFERLGEAHRRTVMLERRQLLETEDATLLASSDKTTDEANETTHTDPLSSVQLLSTQPFTRYRPYPSTDAESRRRHFSFLQHLAVDDILLRTFEYIDCSTMVRTGTTCHRFHELTTRSAEQRVASLADGRLLRSAMKMLRAQEQIEGVNVFEESGNYVPIPIIALRRRIKVSGAGDPEFNGIYFCTGCNGK